LTVPVQSARITLYIVKFQTIQQNADCPLYKEVVIMVVTICIGSSCHLKGSREIVHTLEALIKEHGVEDQVQLTGSFCMGECVKGVCVKVDDKSFSLTPSNTKEFFTQEVLGGLKHECHQF
jgi:hypothetical protein